MKKQTKAQAKAAFGVEFLATFAGPVFGGHGEHVGGSPTGVKVMVNGVDQGDVLTGN